MPIIGNIKTRGELQDELFCMQEERDYFQAKFLEQVSQIKAMQTELEKSKKEIRRLRMFLMEQENNPRNTMPEQIETPKNHNRQQVFESQDGDDAVDDDDDSNPHVAEKDDASSLTQEEMEDLDQQDLDNESAATPANKYIDEAQQADQEVRKSAEKLLAWASYRSSMSSRASRSGTCGDSVLSPSVHTSGSARQSLLGKMIETMEGDEIDEEDDGNNGSTIEKVPFQNDETHVEEKKEEDLSDALGKATLSISP